VGEQGFHHVLVEGAGVGQIGLPPYAPDTHGPSDSSPCGVSLPTGSWIYQNICSTQTQGLLASSPAWMSG
jgi:hypothetical protein